jgi:hypothetical protein
MALLFCIQQIKHGSQVLLYQGAHNSLTIALHSLTLWVFAKRVHLAAVSFSILASILADSLAFPLARPTNLCSEEAWPFERCLRVSTLSPPLGLSTPVNVARLLPLLVSLYTTS